MWAFGLIQMQGGSPIIDPTATPYYGYVLIGSIQNWGGYLISGSLAQLQALQATPQVVGIALLTASSTLQYGELDNVITTQMKNKLNTWLTSMGWPTVPVGWTNKQAILFAFTRLNPNFKFNLDWVTDGIALI